MEPYSKRSSIRILYLKNYERTKIKLTYNFSNASAVEMRNVLTSSARPTLLYSRGDQSSRNRSKLIGYADRDLSVIFRDAITNRWGSPVDYSRDRRET